MERRKEFRHETSICFLTKQRVTGGFGPLCPAIFRHSAFSPGRRPGTEDICRLRQERVPPVRAISGGRICGSGVWILGKRKENCDERTRCPRGKDLCRCRVRESTREDSERGCL